MRRLSIVLALTLANTTLAMPPSQELEPVASALHSATPGYDLEVGKILLAGAALDTFSVVVTPDRMKEWALWADGDRICARYARTEIWTRINSRWLSWLKPKVETKCEPVEANLRARLRSAWRKMILRSRFRRPVQGEQYLVLHGTSYHFAEWEMHFGVREASAYSPMEGSPAFAIVEVVHALWDFVEIPSPESRDILVRALERVEALPAV